MQRILKEAGFSAADILPLKDFKFLYGREMKFNERKMSAIIKTVEEKILPSEFPIIPLSAIRAYKTKGARGPFESRYFKRRTDLIHLLLAEMYKREGRYVERIADTVWAMLEESTWPLSAHLYAYPETRDLVPNVFGENATMHNIDLFAASTGAELALVYTYLKDELDAISPTICKRIRYEVRERIVKPYLNRYYDWMGIYNPTHSNWCAWITSNILMVAPVFSDDDNEYRRIVERAMHSLDTFIESNNADGGCEEGPGYWGHAVAAYFDSLCTLYDMSGGKINVFDNEYIRKIGEYIVDFNIADNLYLNFADARYKIDHDGALIKDFGDRCASAAMSAQGAFLDKASVGAHHANLYRALRSVTTEDFPDCEQASAKTEAYYDVIKVMIARETNNKKQGFFLGIKGGHNGELHNHDDIGCFVVHHNGEAVIIDAGGGRYMNSAFRTHENSWNRYSGAHNVPLINGFEEGTGKKYRSENEVCGGKCLTLDITKAYPEEAGLERFIRRAEIKDGKVIITDDITLTKCGEIDFVFMTVGEPKLSGDKILLDAGRVMHYPTGLEASVEKMDAAACGADPRSNSEPVLHRIHLKSSGICNEIFTFVIE